jgi:hypothetical protein
MQELFWEMIAIVITRAVAEIPGVKRDNAVTVNV